MEFRSLCSGIRNIIVEASVKHALRSLAYITRTFQSAKALQEATVMKRFG